MCLYGVLVVFVRQLFNQTPESDSEVYARGNFPFLVYCEHVAMFPKISSDCQSIMRLKASFYFNTEPLFLTQYCFILNGFGSNHWCKITYWHDPQMRTVQWSVCTVTQWYQAHSRTVLSAMLPLHRPRLTCKTRSGVVSSKSFLWNFHMPIFGRLLTSSSQNQVVCGSCNFVNPGGSTSCLVCESRLKATVRPVTPSTTPDQRWVCVSVCECVCVCVCLSIL